MRSSGDRFRPGKRRSWLMNDNRALGAVAGCPEFTSLQPFVWEDRDGWVGLVPATEYRRGRAPAHAAPSAARRASRPRGRTPFAVSFRRAVKARACSRNVSAPDSGCRRRGPRPASTIGPASVAKKNPEKTKKQPRKKPASCGK